MKQEVKIGQTDYTVLILIRDTAGAPKTGLTNASGGLDVCYVRVETDNDVVLTDGAPVALATPALTDPHLDWGFLEVSATKAPGLYRLDIADGVFATGAWSAVVSLVGTGLDPTEIEFILVPDSPYTGVNVSQWNGTTVHVPTLAGVPYVDVHNWVGAAAPAMTGDAYARLGAPAGASVSADVAAVKADGVEILTRVPDATAGANGGLTICGSNAAATFASLSVTGQLDAGNVLVDAATVLTGNVSIADGLTIPAPSTGNRAGVTITGNGTGSGISVTGGATSGNAMTVVGGNPNGLGVYAQGKGAGSGIRSDAGATGHGLQLSGGSTSGDGLNTTASTSGHGVYSVGVGGGSGLHAYGGLTGNGIEAAGGGTSGDGIYAKAAGTGDGLACHGGGIAGDGLSAIADNDGDGIIATGVGAGEYDINADIHGTLDTVTTCTTNTDLVTAAVIADAVWDEVVTGAFHAGATTAGLYLRNCWQSLFVRVNQCGDAGDATHIDLDAAASAVNDYYKGMLIAIVAGTGVGQARACIGYVGATNMAEIGPAWATNPDADSWFAIINAGSSVVAAIDNIDFSATMKASIETACDASLATYDAPTEAEMNLRTIVAADYTVVGDLGVVQTADHTAAIADIPTVAEFNARTIVSADYTIVADLGTVQTADHTASIAAIKAITDLLPSGIKKNTALANFEFYMVLAADHITPGTGLTIVCQRSIDGAAFANCNTVNATEVSAGIYKINLAASDLNGDVITLKFTEVTCDTRMVTIKTST